jgi:hypothetical protein
MYINIIQIIMYIENEWGKLKKVILGSSQKYSSYNKSDEQNQIDKSVLKEIKEIMEKKYRSHSTKIYQKCRYYRIFMGKRF